MFVDKAERKENIKVLKEVLAVLNNMDTTVSKQDNKYLIFNKDSKKYEVTINDGDTVVRAFNGDVPGALRVIWNEGARIKAKLWLLKFELQDELEPKLVEKIANKVKTIKSGIDTTNEVLNVLDLPGTSVSVLNETVLMKKYEVVYNIQNNPYTMTLEYVGSMVNYTKKSVNCDQDRVFNRSGYMAWKWGWVRRELDKSCVR